MFDVTVRKRLAMSAEAVFNVLSDHANYGRFPGVLSAKLVERGLKTPNGTGALRRIALPGMVFWERITDYTEGSGFDYHIEHSALLPIQQTVGTVRVTPLPDGGCEVVWRSAGRVPLPVFGRLWDRVLRRRIPLLFQGILGAVEAA